MKKFAIILLAISLAGCSTTQKYQVREDASVCADYGVSQEYCETEGDEENSQKESVDGLVAGTAIGLMLLSAFSL